MLRAACTDCAHVCGAAAQNVTISLGRLAVSSAEDTLNVVEKKAGLTHQSPVSSPGTLRACLRAGEEGGTPDV